MIGAIIGDIVGSRYERVSIKSKDFELFTKRSHFTDDTVLTIAIADAVIQGLDYKSSLLHWGRRYPLAGYGASFKEWLCGSHNLPYSSWGNGSAMRVSSMGWLYPTEEIVLKEAKKSAEVTHNHSEGIKGAQATALSIHLARIGGTKQEIRNEITSRFDYDLSRKLEDIRPGYTFEVSCMKSVPESIICFLESSSYEDTIRNAVSLGGDADTMACIAGSIAEAFYGEISSDIKDKALQYLPDDILDVINNYQLMLFSDASG